MQTVGSEIQSVTFQGEQIASNRTRLVLQLCLIVAMTMAAYFPALNAGFIWDDDRYLTNNPLLTAPDGLRRIWFSLDSPSQYFPLTYTSENQMRRSPSG